ncbi:unnamed protein product [Pedinophyceae sp. YPF-701]|nr:unnamed protein product [Pedinophyceae sp. YPF-701]
MVVPQLKPDWANGATRGEIEVRNEDEIVYVSGNTVVFHDVKAGRQRLLPGPARGVACVAVNRKYDLVAFAEKSEGYEPRVHVHSCATLAPVASTNPGRLLDVTALAFSAEGSVLACASGRPDNKLDLMLFEDERGEPSMAVRATADLKGPVRSLSFDPYNSRTILVKYEDSVDLLTWETNLLGYSMAGTFAPVTFHATPLKGACGEVATDAEWLGPTAGHIVACFACGAIEAITLPPGPHWHPPTLTATTAFDLAPKSAHPGDPATETGDAPDQETITLESSARKREGTPPLRRLAVNKAALAVTGAAGPVHVLRRRTTTEAVAYKLVRTIARAGPPEHAAPAASASAPGDAAAAHVAPAPPHRPMPKPLAFGGAALKDLFFASEDGSIEVAPAGGPSTEVVTAAHAAAIVGIASVFGRNDLITASRDGAIRAWTVAEAAGPDGAPAVACRALFSGTMGAPVTAFASSQLWDPYTQHESRGRAFVVLGTAEGAVHILEHSPGSAQCVNVGSLLTHRGPIRYAAIHPRGTEIAVMGGAEGSICFLELRGGAWKGRGVANTPLSVEDVTGMFWAADPDYLVLASAKQEAVWLQSPEASAKPDGKMAFAQRDTPARRVRFAAPLQCPTLFRRGTLAATGPSEDWKTTQGSILCTGPDRGLSLLPIPAAKQAWGGSAMRPLAPDESRSGDGCPHGVPATSLAVGAVSSVDSGGERATAALAIMSGSPDGSVVLQHTFLGLSSPQAPQYHRVTHDMSLGGVSAVSLTAAGAFVAVGGADGTLAILRTPTDALPAGVALSAAPSAAPPLSLELSGADPAAAATAPALEFVVDTYLREQAAEAQERAKSKHDATRAAIADIKAELERCIADNANAPELEQLPESDLVVDVKLAEQIARQGEEQKAQVVAEIERKNEGHDVMRRRLKQECWDAMEVHAASVSGLKDQSTLIVANFALPKDGDALAIGSKLALLRRAERAEAATRPRSTLPRLETATTAGFDLDLDDAGDDGEITYAESELVSRARRITQVYLLLLRAREVRASFNASFDKALQHKQGEVERIRDVNTRIKETLNSVRKLLQANATLTGQPDTRFAAIERDLGQLFVPDPHDGEQPEKVLTVSDDEVKVERFLTAAQRAEKEKEEAARAAHAARMAQDNAPERALKAMMGGTLERVEHDDDEEDLTRPAFMANDKSTWTEEQKRIAADWAVKEKAVLEDREKRIMTLETELRALGNAVAEMREQFDTTLVDLAKERVRAESCALAMEHSVVLLAHSVHALDRYSDAEEERLSERVDAASVRRSRAAAALIEFRKQVEARQEDVDRLHHEDRGLEKLFRRDVSDAEHAQALLALFRRRTYVTQRPPPPMHVGSKRWNAHFGDGGGGGGNTQLQRAPSGVSLTGREGSGSVPRRAPSRSSSRLGVMSRVQSFRAGGGVDTAAKGTQALIPAGPQHGMLDRWLGRSLAGEPAPTLGEGDPYPNMGKEDVPAEYVENLDPRVDMPEGLDPQWWTLLTESRQAKIASEAALKQAQRVLSVMREQLSVLEGEDAIAQAAQNDALAALAAFREGRDRVMFDLHVTLRMKQGLCEVEPQGLSSENVDAVLVPRGTIERVNKEIRDQGASKLDILRGIKDFKRGIYLLQWENQRCDMEAADTVERTREFQLMRVTKEVQAVVKAGSIEGLESSDQNLEALIRHNQTLSQKRLEDRRAALARLQRQAREREKENLALQERVADLEGELGREANVLGSATVSQEGAGAGVNRRMRSLVSRARLRDVAAQQKEQLAALRRELEKLQQGSYPTFLEQRPVLT